MNTKVKHKSTTKVTGYREFNRPRSDEDLSLAIPAQNAFDNSCRPPRETTLRGKTDTFPLNMYHTALHQRERSEFASENEDENDFSRDIGSAISSMDSGGDPGGGGGYSL